MGSEGTKSWIEGAQALVAKSGTEGQCTHTCMHRVSWDALKLYRAHGPRRRATCTLAHIPRCRYALSCPTSTALSPVCRPGAHLCLWRCLCG